VKTKLIFSLCASLTTTTTHLNGLEVLQDYVRNNNYVFYSSTYASQKVNNVGAWNNGIKLKMQLNYNCKYLPMLPTIPAVHSCLLIRGMMFFG
jgi:hypothetical protein